MQSNINAERVKVSFSPTFDMDDSKYAGQKDI